MMQFHSRFTGGGGWRDDVAGSAVAGWFSDDDAMASVRLPTLMSGRVRERGLARRAFPFPLQGMRRDVRERKHEPREGGGTNDRFHRPWCGNRMTRMSVTMTR